MNSMQLLGQQIEHLPDRIRKCAEIVGSGDNLARIAGIPRRTLENYLSGKSEPKATAIAHIAHAANVSADWLLTGVGPADTASESSAVDRSLIDVPRYDLALSAGPGSFVDRAEHLDSIPFPPEFFTRRLGRKPDAMVIVETRGDSMQPTISDRDLVMIDTADHNMTGAIWAFTYDDSVFVKRINVLPDALEIRSDNARDYPSFTIDGPKLDRLHLIGRVVWVGKTL